MRSSWQIMGTPQRTGWMWQMRLLLFSWGSCLEGSGALAFVERAGEGILDDVVKTVALTNQTVSYCCHSCYIYGNHPSRHVPHVSCLGLLFVM